MNPNDHRSSTGLVQRYIGTAYDRLMILVNHMAELLELLEYFRNFTGNAFTPVEHTQVVASNVWIINHPMNKKPSVMCEDTFGNDIEGEIDYVDANNLTVTFSEPIAGTAQLN